MEGVATSMATNVQSVKESVAINREIANTQKRVSELQSRAYLAVVFEGMVPQNLAAGIRFEPRIRIVNQGHSPAHSIRFSVVADTLPFPLDDDFGFTLPVEMSGYSSVINPGLHKMISAVVPQLYSDAEAEQISIGVERRVTTWGIVKYKDAFKSTELFGLDLPTTYLERTNG
jgi:hypothetical protein